MINPEDADLSGKDWAIEVRPKNWLVPVVLVSLRGEKATRGYELMERIGRFGFEQINPGTLYRTLRRMEKEGLCVSEWEASNARGPACRVYSATEAGEGYLDSWAEACRGYQNVLDAFCTAQAGSRPTREDAAVYEGIYAKGSEA